VTANEQLALLQEFHRDKLSMLRRHVAAARYVSHYDFNNTYQYVIAREDVHVRWLVDAIVDLGAEPDTVPEPAVNVRGKGDAALAAVLGQDKDAARAFLEKWRSRIETVTNARHRSMLRVILGETLEHIRFFEQALAGRTDLLGRRADGAGTGGGVMSTRWVE
jgi:bacterioferritin (cytochrome b1)